jgi:nicotinate-nucleotide adenylyltransferase
MAIRTIWYGGTFDPVHLGHLIVARAAAERLEAESVVLLPTGANPLKQARCAPPEDRLAMLHRAIDGDPTFSVSEEEIRQPPPNYTIETVERLQQQDRREFGLLIGADSLRDFPRWKRVEDLLDAVRIFVVARPPEPLDEVRERILALQDQLPSKPVRRMADSVVKAPWIDISSTAIRERVAAGRSIRYLVPEAVDEYIREQGLYR